MKAELQSLNEIIWSAKIIEHQNCLLSYKKKKKKLVM